MMEPCGSRKSHASHHYIASDSNGYWCEGFAATGIDPAAVMAKHEPDHYEYCVVCVMYSDMQQPEPVQWPCEPYRLAEALAASEAKVADAWDEGYEDGVLDGQAQGSGAPGEHETPNPHRIALANQQADL